MVFTTAMETRNGFHYCYGEKEWFSLLLWGQGMGFTTAMDTWNGFHYCYGEKEWFSLLLWRQGMVVYCVFRLILDTYGIIMGNKNHIYCVFRIILGTYGVIMNIKIIYIVFFGLF